MGVEGSLRKSRANVKLATSSVRNPACGAGKTGQQAVRSSRQAEVNSKRRQQALPRVRFRSDVKRVAKPSAAAPRDRQQGVQPVAAHHQCHIGASTIRSHARC